MPRSKTPTVNLEEARARFEEWRQNRRGKARIPAELWAAAVAVARKEGLNRTARELRWSTLQRRHWNGCRLAAREEFVGLCPLHRGFQGTSKWKRFQQWACRLRPSRAASVAIRIRSGCCLGSALKAFLIVRGPRAGSGRDRPRCALRLGLSWR